MRNAETNLVPVWSWMWSSDWTGQSDRTVTPNKRREIYENDEFFGLPKQQHCILQGLNRCSLERRLPGDQTVSLIRAIRHSSPPGRLLMTGLSASLTAPSLNGGAAWNHRRGWGKQFALNTRTVLEKPHLLPLKLTRFPAVVSVSRRRLLPPLGSKQDQERT